MVDDTVKDFDTALRVEADGAVAEVPDHLEFQAVVPLHATLRAQDELGLEPGIVVVAGHVPGKERRIDPLPPETVETRRGDNSQLGVDPETLVREPVGGFQHGTEAVGGEVTDRELAQDVEVPGIAETLGEGNEPRMDLLGGSIEEIGIDRDDQLVGELRTRP